MAVKVLWSDHGGFDPYVSFHQSLGRYIGRERNACLSCIDIDAVEYCWACYEPVAAVERTCSYRYKPTYITGISARRMNVPAFLVRYPVTLAINDLARLDVTVLPRGHTFNYSRGEFAEWLWSLRVPHWRSDTCPGAEWALNLPRIPPIGSAA